MVDFNPFELCLVEKTRMLDKYKKYVTKDNFDEKNESNLVNLIKLKVQLSKNKYDYFHIGDIIKDGKDIFIISLEIKDTYEDKAFYHNFGFYECVFNLMDENYKHYFKIKRESFKNIENIIFLTNYEIIGNIFVNKNYEDMIKKERFTIFKYHNESLEQHYLEHHYLDRKDLTDLKRFNIRIFIKYYSDEYKSVQYVLLNNQKPKKILELNENKNWYFLIKFTLVGFTSGAIEITNNTVFISNQQREEFMNYFLKQFELNTISDKHHKEIIEQIHSFYIGINKYGVITLFSFNKKSYPLKTINKQLLNICSLYRTNDTSINKNLLSDYTIIDEKWMENKEKSNLYEKIFLYYIMNDN